MENKISLIDLPRAMRANGVITTYPTVWRAAVDGRIPAERAQRRWWIDPADLPHIAEILTPAG